MKSLYLLGTILLIAPAHAMDTQSTQQFLGKCECANTCPPCGTTCPCGPILLDCPSCELGNAMKKLHGQAVRQAEDQIDLQTRLSDVSELEAKLYKQAEKYAQVAKKEEEFAKEAAKNMQLATSRAKIARGKLEKIKEQTRKIIYTTLTQLDNPHLKEESVEDIQRYITITKKSETTENGFPALYAIKTGTYSDKGMIDGLDIKLKQDIIEETQEEITEENAEESVEDEAFEEELEIEEVLEEIEEDVEEEIDAELPIVEDDEIDGYVDLEE